MRKRLALGLLLCASAAFPCSLAFGYFHQVTQLRGRIVGVAPGDLRHFFRWTRQMVYRDDAVLSLYRYQWPPPEHRPYFRRLAAGRDGSFDFGPLPVGHYELIVEIASGRDRFDVQIVETGGKMQTDAVVIDMSPVHPDCSGGHEFIHGVR